LQLSGCGSGGGGVSRAATVDGYIRWKDDKPFAAPATIVVELRDVSLADGPAELLGRGVVNNVAYRDGTRAGVRFTVGAAGGLKPDRVYALFARVDTNGDGRVGVGDYVSETLNPVTSEPVVVQVTELEKCGTPGGGGYCAEDSGRPLLEDE
jgi:uncharacterized lipoprotein YbaY